MSLTARRRRTLRFSFALGLLGAGACGARTGLHIPPPAPPEPECVVDADCPGIEDLCNPVECRYPEADAGVAGGPVGTAGRCVKLTPVDCDDNYPCTTDLCEPATGACHYEVATLDLDGDGYKAPLVGALPGAPDSCGDDCDDTNAAAHPGALEVCDGVDNDCNGIVDDNASFIPLSAEPVRISGPIAPAGPGGLAWSGTSYAAVYTGSQQGFDMYRSMLDFTGQAVPNHGEALVTLANADSAGGPIVWVGDRYGLAWQDRRDGDYEVYFTLLDEEGDKVLPDTRVTFAPGFSINMSLTWNSKEFILVWQDEREGLFDLYAQRITVDGALAGDNIKLTSTQGFDNESPSVAAGTTGIGVAWAIGDAFNHLIQFQTFDYDMNPVSQVEVLTDGTTEAVYPTVVWNKDRYVVAWFDRSANPTAIYATVLAEDGSTIVPPTAVTNPGPFRSRYPFMRPLGDRVLFVYSDDRDQNNGYEIYSRMVTRDLLPLSPEQRLTFAGQDSIYPIAAFGPEGDVGVLFRDDREGGAHHVYFTRLGCVTSPVP